MASLRVFVKDTRAIIVRLEKAENAADPGELLKRADECLGMAGAHMDGAKVFMKRMTAILEQVRLWFELVSCRTVGLFNMRNS